VFIFLFQPKLTKFSNSCRTSNWHPTPGNERLGCVDCVRILEISGRNNSSFCGFIRSLEAKSSTVPKIKWQLVPSTACKIYYSLL